jgi:GNAT superfamily N-acetyltransferase
VTEHSPAAPLAIRPVTEATWADFADLFAARGGPHHCWCALYRFPGVASMAPAAKRDAMKGLVAAGRPIGVLAYEGSRPIGWCSVAPRPGYGRLARSRTMPRVTPAEVDTWTILCLFVPRSHRGRGVARALLGGAVDYARASGAAVVEAYPHDAAGISATHRGHSALYRAAGFGPDGARWWLDPRSPAR